MQSIRIGLIGSGVSSLAFINKLLEGNTNKKFVISCFEKATKVGGRLATRNLRLDSLQNDETKKNQTTIDFGAQYFTAKELHFQSFLKDVSKISPKEFTVEEWNGDIKVIGHDHKLQSLSSNADNTKSNNNNNNNIINTDSGSDNLLKRFVGVPDNNSLARLAKERALMICKEGSAMKHELNFYFQHRLVQIQQLQNKKWKLLICHDEKFKNLESNDSNMTKQKWWDQMEFDFLIFTVPSQQALDVIKNSENFIDKSLFAKLTDTLNMYRLLPCWSCLICLNQKLMVPFDALFINLGTKNGLSWVARNSSKPGRNQEKDTWILHATVPYSEQHLEKNPDDVKFMMLKEFSNLVKPFASNPQILKETDKYFDYFQAHRWRYSIPDINSKQANHLNSFISMDQEGIAFCGDWCNGGRIEGAFMSGFSLALHLLEQQNKN